MEHKASPAFLEVEKDDERVVRGLFSVFGHVDESGDVVHRGAFKKTLQERLPRGRIKALWQHDTRSPPVGVVVELEEITKRQLPAPVKSQFPDATGALAGAIRVLPTPRGDEVLTGVREKAITEGSFGFDAIKFDFETEKEKDLLIIQTDGQVRNLREVRLWDISFVNWGMQEAALMLQKKGAIPFKETPKSPKEASWDGPAQVAAAEVDDLKVMAAWVDPENRDIKSGYKLPHHLASGSHAVVWRGVTAAMSRLMQAATQIPSGDRRAVYNHLSKHYRQFDEDPPDFKFVQTAYTVGVALEALDEEAAVPSGWDAKRFASTLTELSSMMRLVEPQDAVSLARQQGLRRRIEIAEREGALYN